MMTAGSKENQVERWGIFELSLDGPSDGNPFLDVTLSAEFSLQDHVLTPEGFYDGEGVYRVRFMPDAPGEWRYVTRSNRPELDGRSGTFTCVEASPGNHGPVHVRNQFHFAYADGIPYYPFGTTCYAWTHQGDELEERTLATLRRASFNKLRMCVFPKDYLHNRNEPVYYPFLRNEAGEHDFTRFDPRFFRHFEQRVGQLRDLGIEADIIIFHPYDRWGYATMDAESDYRYLRYLIARLAAYRNVWWSMANEYDLLLDVKPMEQWDQYFRITREKDPYQHLRSIHNCDVNKYYDHTKPWITHASIQNWDVRLMKQWRAAYGKPVIDDEFEYEGNVPPSYGNLTAREMVHRFWIAVINGGYATHGEMYLHPEDILWWSKGGVLHGESEPRIGFLRRILEEDAIDGLTPMEDRWEWSRMPGGRSGEYRLIYFGERQPARWWAGIPENFEHYEIDIIDTWEMTITPIAAHKSSNPEEVAEIELPGRPYLALRIRPKHE